MTTDHCEKKGNYNQGTGGGKMNTYKLDLVSAAHYEQKGDLESALCCLRRAKGLTKGHGELCQLDSWIRRLEKEKLEAEK